RGRVADNLEQHDAPPDIRVRHAPFPGVRDRHVNCVVAAQASEADALGVGNHLDYLGVLVFFFQAEDGIRDRTVTGVQTCALPICVRSVFRLVSRFGDYEIDSSAVAAASDRLRIRVTWAARDSISRFGDWRNGLGAA